MPATVADMETGVSRYVDFVYAAACRQMGDRAAAEDVTQAVFLVMAQKRLAGALPEEKYMLGWLLQTTRFAVKAARRSAIRRGYHEKQAGGVMREEAGHVGSEVEFTELRAVLDDALLRLGKVDREVVMRRYLRDEPIGQIAASVGLSENGAGRRIARAVEKLRKILARRGVVTPIGGIVAVMGAEAVVKAPTALAGTVGGSSAATIAANGVAKSVVGRMIAAKALAVTTAGVVVVAAGGMVVAKIKSRGSADSLRPVIVAAVATPAATQATGKLPFTVSKATTVVTEPLREDGVPDYVAALNARNSAGVTPQNNGFVKWMEVLGTGEQIVPGVIKARVLAMTGARETPDTGVTFDYGEYLQKTEKLSGREQNKALTELGVAMQTMWTAEQSPRVADFLKTVQGPLDGVVEAAGRPRWWSPYLATAEFDIPLVSRRVEAEAVTALCVRSTLRAKSGDFDGFLADAIAARRLARHAAGDCFLERLTATSMERHACEAMGAVVGSGILNADQVAAVKKANDALPPLPSIWQAADERERWSKLEMAELVAMGRTDVLDHMYDDPKNPHPSPWKSIDIQAVDWDVVLKRTNAIVDEEVVAVKAPTWTEMQAKCAALNQRGMNSFIMLREPDSEKPLAPHPGESREAYSTRVADAMFMLVSPAYRIGEESYRKVLLEGEMLRVLIGAADVKARMGNWPETLETVAGVKAPVDMYSPEEKDPVIYMHGKEGARIYSVGPNHMDDGGIDDTRMRADDFGVGVVTGFGEWVP